MFDDTLRFSPLWELGRNVNEHYQLHGRFWIEGPEGTYLGYGRVVLLERIRDLGSITAAAQSMKMSYRHAWKLVDSMNRQANKPVVSKKTGGRGGGGASLTDTGEQAITCFWSAYKEFNEYLDQRSTELNL